MLTPFDGLHIHGEHGVPAMGYLAEFSKNTGCSQAIPAILIFPNCLILVNWMV
jgi:hypothetical protein